MDEPGEVHVVSHIVPGTEISGANMQHGTVDVEPPWSTLLFWRLHFTAAGNKEWVLAGTSMAGTSPSTDETASWHQDKFAVWCAFSEKGDQVLFSPHSKKRLGFFFFFFLRFGQKCK